MEENKTYPTNTGGAEGIFDEKGALTSVTKLEGEVTYRTGVTTSQAFKHSLKEKGHEVNYYITPEELRKIFTAINGDTITFDATQGTIALIICADGSTTTVTTVDELVEAISNPETTAVRLESDMTMTDITSVDHTMVFDGNGKTITAADGKNAFKVLGTDTTLTINNANITTTGSGAAVVVGAKGITGSNLKAVIGKNTTITSDKFGIAVFGENSTVDVEGKITATEVCVGGNGSKGYAGTIVNIKEGAELVSTNDIAIYIPQDGELNISGGTITGATAIGVKAGKINITGGTLTATGEAVDPTTSYNGQAPTGDVIAVEVNKSYAGGKTDKNIEINVTGGELISTNAYKIREINSDASDITIGVTGKYAVATKIADTITVYDDHEIITE